MAAIRIVLHPVIDVQRQAPQWRLIPGVTALVRQAARQAIRQSGLALQSHVEVAIALSNDANVRIANKAWRQQDKPTNVLSFPAVPVERLPETPFLGDIILAYETVAEEAAKDHKPLEDHISHLIVHGVLHLLGHDHMTNEEASRMETLETAILAALGIPDPYESSEPMETEQA